MKKWKPERLRARGGRSCVAKLSRLPAGTEYFLGVFNFFFCVLLQPSYYYWFGLLESLGLALQKLKKREEEACVREVGGSRNPPP